MLGRRFKRKPVAGERMEGERSTLRPQKRAIFFVFDGGTGLGHLRRLSCIAKTLQGAFSCLIVTSRRAASWFVPSECEYVHLPAWDSLLPEKAAYWGREPFLGCTEPQALNLRRKLLRGIVDAFEPDVIFVDHLPLGMREELGDIIENSACLKYLITRGVQNETEDLAKLLLAGRAQQAIQRHYDRVFVAMDPQVFDFQTRYPAFNDVASKVCPVGYVIEPIDRGSPAACRKARGLGSRDLWVVASAGGGQHGEQLITASCELAATHPDIIFDIVIGPRSRLLRDELLEPLEGLSNLRLHKEVADMAQLHAAADIVISSGGYNSLLETLQGNARILCVPSRKSERDEQYAHAARLRAFATIDLDLDAAKLSGMFERALAALKRSPNIDRRRDLDFAGATHIRQIVLADASSLDQPQGGQANNGARRIRP